MKAKPKFTLLNQQSSIQTAVQVIDTGPFQIALIVDEANRLIGTVTDGDIRRGLLAGLGLDQPVSKIMNNRPVVASLKDSRESILNLMNGYLIRQVPVLDLEGQVVRIETLRDLLQSDVKENWVFLMAGGLGTRLRPLTEKTPKPLLKVGNKPIIENIIESFVGQGYRNLFISVNYMGDMIKEQIGDGSRWGARIEYIEEKERKGTAGALSLLRERPTSHMIVMNADLVTQLNYQSLIDFHTSHKAKATICVTEYDFQVPYGVIKVDGFKLTGIEEKPTQKFFVNAGIYVFDPSVIDLVPKGQPMDMHTLFDALLAAQDSVAVFPIREQWMDIGQMQDYFRANGEAQ